MIMGIRDYKIAFQKAGITVTTVEYNMADCRDNDDARMLSQFGTFIESIRTLKK